jgi:hypothetical protein
MRDKATDRPAKQQETKKKQRIGSRGPGGEEVHVQVGSELMAGIVTQSLRSMILVGSGSWRHLKPRAFQQNPRRCKFDAQRT